MSGMLLGRQFALSISSDNFNVMKIEKHLDSGVDLVFISGLRRMQFDLLGNLFSRKFRGNTPYRDQFLIMLDIPIHLFGPVRNHDDEAACGKLDEYVAGATGSYGIEGFDGFIVDLSRKERYEECHGLPIVLEEIIARINLLGSSNPRLSSICLKDPDVFALNKALLTDNDLCLSVYADGAGEELCRLCRESNVPLFKGRGALDSLRDKPGGEEAAFLNSNRDMLINVVGDMPYAVDNHNGADELSGITVEVPNTYSFKHQGFRFWSPELFDRIGECFIEGPGYIVLKNVFADCLDEIRDAPIMKGDTRWDPLGSDAARLNDFGFLSKLICNSAVTAITEYILGWDCLIDNMAFTVSYPQAGGFGPHIDSPFDRNPGCKLPPDDYIVSVQCIYCLDDFTKERGTFFTIPGSQSAKVHLNALNRRRFSEELNADSGLIVEADAGDVIVAIGNAWHGALDNVTDAPRRGLLVQHVSSVVSPRDDFDLAQLSDEMLKGYTLDIIDKLYRNRRSENERNALVKRWVELKSG